MEDFYEISGPLIMNNRLLPIFVKEIVRYLDWKKNRRTNARTLEAKAGTLTRRFLKDKSQ